MLRKIGLCLLGLILLVGGLLYIALKDNPARAALGERKQVQTTDAEIHYFVSGDEQAKPVALLPSYARSVSDFNELVAQLNQQGYKTIAMQPRGIDGSSLSGLEMTYAVYAADLAAALQEWR